MIVKLQWSTEAYLILFLLGIIIFKFCTPLVNAHLPPLNVYQFLEANRDQPPSPELAPLINILTGIYYFHANDLLRANEVIFVKPTFELWYTSLHLSYAHGIIHNGQDPRKAAFDLFAGQDRWFSFWQSMVAFRKSWTVNTEISLVLAAGIDHLYLLDVPLLFSLVDKVNILRVFNFMLLWICAFLIILKFNTISQVRLATQGSIFILLLTMCAAKMAVSGILRTYFTTDVFALSVLVQVAETIWIILLIVDVFFRMELIIMEESRGSEDEEQLSPEMHFSTVKLDENEEKPDKESSPLSPPKLGVIRTSSTEQSAFRKFCRAVLASIKRQQQPVMKPITLLRHKSEPNPSRHKTMVQTTHAKSAPSSIDITMDFEKSAKTKESRFSSVLGESTFLNTHSTGLRSEEIGSLDMPQELGHPVFRELV